jgi:MoxR-like ATPase
MQLSKQALSVQFDLLERDAEAAAVEALISATRAAAAPAIEGPPGIGKSSLIAEARARGSRGMQVVGARLRA